MISTYGDKTPQQIREDREKQKRIERTEALRAKIRAEIEFLSLPEEGKLAVKKDLLKVLGIRWDVPLKDQDFLIRLIYYKKGDMLHQNSYLMNYYEEHRHEYKRYRSGIPDRSAMAGADAGRTAHTSDGVYRDADDGISSPIFQPDTGPDDDSGEVVSAISEEHIL